MNKEQMDKKSLFRNLLSFLPLLIMYTAIVLLFSHDDLIADEGRYLDYATNLTNGFYTDSEKPSLSNGPGYPLVISILVLFNASYLVIKLLNVIFLIGAVFYFYKTLINYISPKQAIAFSYLLGLSTVLLKWMLYIHSESFTIFLSCGFLYHFINLNRKDSIDYLNMAITAIFLGFLVLTKVIFGYVILCSLIGYLIIYFFMKSLKILNVLIVLVGGLLICTPYLFYTYSLTGKTFYWGTQGGEILYWRSTPFENEYGDWISASHVLGKVEHNYIDNSAISQNHWAFVQSLEKFTPVQRDSLYTAKAMENIRHYPFKYIQNTGVSALRLFFNYPFSYTPQKTSTYFYIVPNMFLVVFLVLSIFLSIRNLRAIPFEIRFIMLISLLYIGGTILLNGRVRHLIPILPMLSFFIIYVFTSRITFKINEDLGHSQMNKPQKSPN